MPRTKTLSHKRQTVNKKPLSGRRVREIPIAPPCLDPRGEELFEVLKEALPPDLKSEIGVCVDIVTITVPKESLVQVCQFLKDSQNLSFNYLCSISVVDYEGKNRRLVTEIPANNRWPDASPDGKKLVFSSSKAGNYDLYTINLDGTELTQLTRHPLRDIHPAWSPDGTRIAFISVRDGNHEIYLLEIATGKISRVTTSNTRDDFPSWSPDGKKLVYISQREGSTDLYERAVK